MIDRVLVGKRLGLLELAALVVSAVCVTACRDDVYLEDIVDVDEL